MKVAIIGIGVAGAYLMNQLSSFHDVKVTGFERMEEKNHDAVCAWATCDNVMSKYAKKCGLDFENYVLHDGKRMTVDVGKGNGEPVAKPDPFQVTNRGSTGVRSNAPSGAAMKD